LEALKGRLNPFLRKGKINLLYSSLGLGFGGNFPWLRIGGWINKGELLPIIGNWINGRKVFKEGP